MGLVGAVDGWFAWVLSKSKGQAIRDAVSAHVGLGKTIKLAHQSSESTHSFDYWKTLRPSVMVAKCRNAS